MGIGDRLISILGLVLTSIPCTAALNIVVPGGTGPIGSNLASRLTSHSVTILCRNSFLAAAPNRVTEQFGWVGQAYLQKNPHVSVRDWDGGDLLDIVGQDWLGWQEDTLAKADVVVHLVGGFTEQRVMACERLVRESNRVNKNALHITVSPLDDEIGVLSPSAVEKKKERILVCENMVSTNCFNSLCLRIETYRQDQGCSRIQQAIEEWAANRN
jgi:hypothetical protein